MSITSKPAKRLKRRRRVRAKVRGTAERPRLSVFRSNKGLFAQLVDDVNGRTVAAVNWTEPEFRSLQSMEQAGVESCVFDRGGYQYHGRVAALAEGAREGGLAF
jgi:large subunit ribosomal protein L18